MLFDSLLSFKYDLLLSGASIGSVLSVRDDGIILLFMPLFAPCLRHSVCLFSVWFFFLSFTRLIGLEMIKLGLDIMQLIEAIGVRRPLANGIDHR